MVLPMEYRRIDGYACMFLQLIRLGTPSVAIMRVRTENTIQARTVTRDSKRNITLREMHA